MRHQPPIPALVRAGAAAIGLRVDAAFPGGNVVVESVSADTIHVRPDLRDTDGEWFYWSFRVHGAAGRTIAVRFTNAAAVGIRGPAVSDDGGRTWRWAGEASVRGNGFDWPVTTDQVWFCVGMPYQLADWERFSAARAGAPGWTTAELCRTRHGRAVPLARLQPGGEGERRRVVLTARHHSCEMMASWTLEGLLAWAMEDDDEAARWWRASVEALIVPFIDLDGVEDGDQGKNRLPRDHARDYAGESIHPETRALRPLLQDWAGGRLDAAIDLHCPWLKGQHNQSVYLVGFPGMEPAQRQLTARLAATATSLPVHPEEFVAFGTAWNTAAAYAKGTTLPRWAAEAFPGIRLATAFEIPYADASGTVVDVASARRFGADIGRALAGQLRGRAIPHRGM